MARCREDRTEFVSFFDESLRFANWNYVAVNQHFEPKQRFVSFLQDNADLRNPFCLGPRSTCGTIIRRYPSSRPEELFTQDLRVSPIRQLAIKSDNSHRKGFCPVP
jgi:hypothetical protein